MWSGFSRQDGRIDWWMVSKAGVRSRRMRMRMWPCRVCGEEEVVADLVTVLC